MGATTDDILLQVLTAAILLSLLEASLVLVLGIASALVSRIVQLGTVLTAGSILLAFAFAGLVGSSVIRLARPRSSIRSKPCATSMRDFGGGVVCRKLS